jgi:hypothetical protein
MGETMADDLKEGEPKAPDNLMGAELARRGFEFMLATDLPRQWATGAQVFVQEAVTIIIFREQTTLVSESGEPSMVLKNVSSIVMPTEAAMQVRDLLNRNLPQGPVDEAA